MYSLHFETSNSKTTGDDVSLVFRWASGWCSRVKNLSSFFFFSFLSRHVQQVSVQKWWADEKLVRGAASRAATAAWLMCPARWASPHCCHTPGRLHSLEHLTATASCPLGPHTWSNHDDRRSGGHAILHQIPEPNPQKGSIEVSHPPTPTHIIGWFHQTRAVDWYDL